MSGHHVYLEVSEISSAEEEEGAGCSVQGYPFDKDSDRSESDNSDT